MKPLMTQFFFVTGSEDNQEFFMPGINSFDWGIGPATRAAPKPAGKSAVEHRNDGCGNGFAAFLTRGFYAGTGNNV